MQIGVISDTHGFLDPRLPELFAGVDHILHGGDIGPAAIINALEQIAPVTAVLGNNDFDPAFRETEIIHLAGRKFLLHHIVEPARPTPSLRALLARENPDAVIFGHTHKHYQAILGTTFYLNPGYAGRNRFNQPRSVARLTLTPAGIHTDFLPL